MSSDSIPASAHSIPAPLREVIELFNGDLAEISFPGVDRFALEDLRLEAVSCHDELVAARALVDAASREFEVAVEALRKRVGKGVAYARVFAEGDDALMARLNALSVGRKAPERRTRARRKSRKPVVELAELPLVVEPAA